MRRIALWLLATLSVLVLLFTYSTSTSGSLALSSPPAAASGSSAGSATSGGDTVTGQVSSTRWGPVQVALTVSGGKITDVQVLQQPTGNGKDEEINARALPVLTQETLDEQSADIDMVSGATVTSEGYITSLQSALDQAGM